MNAQSPVPNSDPLMIAWDEFKRGDDFANAKRWAVYANGGEHPHLEGSLWALFLAGYKAATARAADLHESIDSSSDAERLENLPGAGAMGAVIEYRDEIRKTVAVQ